VPPDRARAATDETSALRVSEAERCEVEPS
jgi:hypothetical protein